MGTDMPDISVNVKEVDAFTALVIATGMSFRIPKDDWPAGLNTQIEEIINEILPRLPEDYSIGDVALAWLDRRTRLLARD
jgi:hypothetical protein